MDTLNPNSNSSDSYGSRYPWLIAVHGGAGYHSTDPSSEKAVKSSLRSACTVALEVLRRKEKSSGAVERAICVLEDDVCLNAGYGSNLTTDGTVECDASIVEGVTHDFGSAGAVQGVKNPISLARAILVNSQKPHPLGRVPPLTLVGTGAHSFASSAGLQLVSPEAHISERARNDWKRWKTRLEGASSAASVPDSSAMESSTIARDVDLGDYSTLQDTVGAVACDASGGLSAGVSSGGLLLKYPGRVGEAAVFGAGVWAHSPPGGQRGVACSVSGTGEAIIRTSFARTLAEALQAAPPEDTHEVIQSKLEVFMDEIQARGEEPNVGVLLVTKEPIVDGDGDEDDEIDPDFDSDSEVENQEDTDQPRSGRPGGTQSPQQQEKIGRQIPQPGTALSKSATTTTTTSPSFRLRLWCAFTTESMAIAYASSEGAKPRALILRHQTHRRNRNTDTDVKVKRGVHITALPLSR